MLPSVWLQPHQTHSEHGMGCSARRDAQGLPEAESGCVEAASNLSIATGVLKALVTHPTPMPRYQLKQHKHTHRNKA